MNKFKKGHACPKCGEREAKADYRPSIENDILWYARKYDRVTKWPEGEHIRRTCGTCGFAWPEACL